MLVVFGMKHPYDIDLVWYKCLSDGV